MKDAQCLVMLIIRVGDGFDDVMTVNNQGGIHAFVSSTSAALFGGLQDFPDINTPYSQVLLTDLNSGKHSCWLTAGA